jgi:hypothetical protein
MLAFKEGFIIRVSASVLMIVAAMIAGPARAEFVTGNDLYKKCNSNAPKDATVDVFFTPKSGHYRATVGCLLCARGGQYGSLSEQ